MPGNFTIEGILGLSGAGRSGSGAPVSDLAARIKTLIRGSDTDWAEAAWALIQDPQDWPAKEELLLQVVTDKSPSYGFPKRLADFSPFLHLEVLNAEGGTRLVKLYTALGEVLKQGGPRLEGEPEIAQGTGLQKLQDAWRYFTQAREEINKKLEGTSYQPIPAEAEGGTMAEPPSFDGADGQTVGQSLICSSWSRTNFYPPLPLQSDVYPAPPYLPAAGLTLDSRLTVERFNHLAGCRYPDWENVAWVLITDLQDWGTKEKLILQVLTDKSYHWRRPKTLREFSPFRDIKSIDEDGGTRLVKLYTAMGDVLRQSWTHPCGKFNLLRQVGEGKFWLAWNYFIGARAQINEKLRWMPRPPLFPLQFIPEYAEDALFAGDPSCSRLNAQTLGQGPSHRLERWFPSPLQGVAYSMPSSGSLEAVRSDNSRWTGSQAYQPVRLIGDALALGDSQNVIESLGRYDAAFLRARIAAHGVEVRTRGATEQWLVFEIAPNFPRRDRAAAGLVPRIVQAVTDGGGPAWRAINILLGPELKLIPVCQLENGRFTTPDGKKYKYLPANIVANYVATYGYKACTPEGEESMYLVFAHSKEKFEAKPNDLDAADIPLFMDFANKVKEALASNDLKHRWTLATYRRSLTAVRGVARHLRRHHKEGLAWVCAQPKTTDWTKTLESFTPPLSYYVWGIQWFCQNERFAEKLIPVESDEDDRSIPDGGLTPLPGPSGLSNKRANGDLDLMPLSKQSR